MAHTVTRFLDTTYQLAECPTWDDRHNRLLWADIQGRTIQSMDWASKDITSWQFDNEVGSFGLTDDDRLIVSVWDKILLFDPATGDSEVLAEIETDKPTTRLNDGKVGPDGAFWVGTMDTKSPRDPIAGLYRVNGSSDVEEIRDELQCSNGLAWTPDGTYMYHSDTSPGWIECYSFDPATGTLGSKMLYAQQTNNTGRPDGATVDVEGNYWSAGVSAGVLNCFSANGELLHAIKMPVQKPTMPCFCGPELDQLVVTSIRQESDPTSTDADCMSGGLFLVEGHGQKGLETYRFKTG
ncbi:SMP-30/gluconolactonase/LRE family protein [Roseibium denhamense]|uniref:Sugar lactone lactonase YvrE n=1 Tax=Roseibium denhamense TaxID=76305 RepID=A0ABY1N9W4_9HYPH|nr:SMP-30/gluconolactonase/LRE family protein [Roseibium denhamense]MTI05670.1 SMP-30/gluconolactonase/LRE family protein [Roseibium denhamense]SMP04090.1 Sugar lactone lactonase YvrE [Roseibium denhamense]